MSEAETPVLPVASSGTLSRADADHWLSIRPCVIAALADRGLRIMSTATRVWLAPLAALAAQAAPAQEWDECVAALNRYAATGSINEQAQAAPAEAQTAAAAPVPSEAQTMRECLQTLAGAFWRLERKGWISAHEDDDSGDCDHIRDVARGAVAEAHRLLDALAAAPT